MGRVNRYFVVAPSERCAHLIREFLERKMGCVRLRTECGVRVHTSVRELWPCLIDIVVADVSYPIIVAAARRRATASSR